MDNASGNKTTLRDVSRWLLATKHIIWNANERRLRCFSHVGSIIVDTFTDNKPLKAKRVARAPKSTPKKTSLYGNVQLMLYRSAMRSYSDTSTKEPMECTPEVSDDFLHPTKENDTRCF